MASVQGDNECAICGSNLYDVYIYVQRTGSIIKSVAFA